MKDPNVTPKTSEEADSSPDLPYVKVQYLTESNEVVWRVIHTRVKDIVEEGEPYSVDAPPSLDHLDFVPQPMVGWYRPSELIKAGIGAVVSAVFGSYADKRDVQSVLTEEEWHDYSIQLDDQGEIWFDYVADLGDGWDSTYTIARLLAEKELGFDAHNRCVKDPTKALVQTQKGQILVMGGDEIYPTPSREEYNNRTIQPYRYAFPFSPFSAQAPHLFLIPGNHDWYDGLNSFFKLFCNNGWVGGWRTWQRRSYFALKLDTHLWLWGIDIQLNSNIDQPQLNYFEHIAQEVMHKGSKIILCTAEPSWVYVDAQTKEEKNPMKLEKKKEEIYQNLGHLEKRIINTYEHEVIIGLAGDWHNYTRYQAKDDSQHQRFVAGGGGAYLYPTHNMPTTLKLPKKFGGAEYEREAIFPNESESKRLATWSLLFSLFRSNWGFIAFLGGFFVLLSWILQSGSKVSSGNQDGQTLLDKFSVSFDLGAFIEVIAHSPESMVYLTLLVAGLMAFSSYTSWPRKIPHGGLHGLTHVALFLGLIYVFAHLNLKVLHLDVNQPMQALLFGIEMFLFGGLLGGFVFGFYLWFSNRVLKIHDNEVLLCQSDPDYKSFLRFHIKKDGQITIYPIGVKRVNRKQSWNLDKTKRQLAAWALQPNAKGGASWFEPKKGDIQDFAQLIEDPIALSYKDDQTKDELCQSDPDYKSFLRFHIKKDGQITIYPIGVKRVNRKQSWNLDKTKRQLAAWALQPNAKGGASWFEPKKGDIQDFAQLIEDPIALSYKDDQTKDRGQWEKSALTMALSMGKSERRV